MLKDWWLSASKREEREILRLREENRKLKEENRQLREQASTILAESQDLLENHKKIVVGVERIKNENAHLKSILAAVSLKHRV